MRPEPRDLYARPEALVAEAIDAYGVHTVIDTCLALIDGHDDYDLLAMPLTYLGGVAAHGQLERGELAARGQDFWPRTWGVRGLGNAWLPYAADGVVTAMGDRHWRVREAAAKVALRHRVVETDEALIGLVTDDEPRVQVAAIRASASIGDERHLEAIEALSSPDRPVVLAARSAVRTLRRVEAG